MTGPIDVETEFTAFVRAFGGEVLSDSLGPSPHFLNADYLFRDAGGVAELKRLVEDPFEDRRIRRRIEEKFRGWIRQRLIRPIYGMSQIQSRRLPLLCQRALLAVFSKPLRGRLRKANDQIKDTLKALGLIEA